MTKLDLPRRGFLSLAGSVVIGSAFPKITFAETRPLNFGYQNTSWGTIGMIAQSLDLFKKSGANVKIFTFDSGKSTRDAMISGRIDVGVIGATPFVIGAAKGQMEAIALALYGGKTLAVVAGVKSGIKTIKDLKGHRIGSQLGSATDFVFQHKILPRAGLSSHDVHIINVTFQNQLAALAAGSIDAFAGVEPFPSVAEVEKLGRVITDYSPYDLEPILLAANESAVNNDRHNMIAFLRGWLAAVNIYQNHRNEAVEIVLKHFKHQGFAVNEKVIRLMLSKIDVSPNFPPELNAYLTNESKLLMRQKTISAIPDWGKLLNASLLAEARKKA